MQTSLVSITVASVVTLPFALATLPGSMPGVRATLSVLALGAVGTALAFVIFYKLINEVGAGKASLVAYLAPGVALVYGALLLDEEITVVAVAGLALILAGVGIAARRSPLQERPDRSLLLRVVDHETGAAVGQRDAA